MSSESCAICGPKRTSRALCNCCQQYLCRDHLKEHDDLLNAQLEPLADNINQLAERLQQFDIDSCLQLIRIQLDQWRQSALRSIEHIYEQKSNELTQLIHNQLAHLRKQTEQIQVKVSHLIREQDATNHQIESLFTRIHNIEKETNDIQHNPIEFNIRPLVIDNSCIHFNAKNVCHDHNQLTLTPVIQTISSSPNNVGCIACNDTYILLHRHPSLTLYDHNLNLIKQTHPYSDLSITDLCWSSTMNRFIILTDENIFSLDETRMLVEKCNISARRKGHWHTLTCSLTSLYITAYKWGTFIYQFNIRPSSLEFNQRWQTPLTCTRDESIDHLIHNNNNAIAMIIQNGVNKNKRFQLRNDQTLECVWSNELHQCQMTIHRHRFCSISRNQ